MTGLDVAANDICLGISDLLGRERANLAGCGIPKVYRDVRRSARIQESTVFIDFWWAVQDSNLRPPACKAGALTN